MLTININNAKKIFKRLDEISSITTIDLMNQAIEEIEGYVDIHNLPFVSLYNKLTVMEINMKRKFHKFTSKDELLANLEIALSQEDYENEKKYFLKKIKKIGYKISELIYNKVGSKTNLERVIRIGLVIALAVVGIPTNPILAGTQTVLVAAAGGFAVKAQKLCDGVLDLFGVVMFALMAMDLLKVGIKKDFDCVWQILLKFGMATVALVSYKPLFYFIKEFFADMY